MQIKNNYPMSDLTTLRIGGNAKEFVEVKTQEELIEAISYAKQQAYEYFIIGGGSNLLVSDEGIDKLVIKNSIAGINPVIPSGNEESQDFKPRDPSPAKRDRDDKIVLKVKSGTMLQDLVDFAIEHGLDGLQKLSGIPGTVGGAIFGNAGAYGQSISDHLTSVVILSEANNLITLAKEQCEFNYRDSIFKKNGFIILEATFLLETKNAIAQNVVSLLQKEADEILQKRLVKYPKGIRCPGSFFKNIIASSLPPEILAKIPPEKIVYGKLPAGVLLEEVGAKGDKLGDIEIAPYHANLFINRGNGTAKDFYNLAKKYADLVKTKFGITLEPEVQLINLPPLE